MATGTMKYTKKQTAEYKKRGGIWLAKDILTDINWNSGKYMKPLHAKFFAAIDVNAMTTRQVYAFLKKNGCTFDATRAAWNAESEATS